MATATRKEGLDRIESRGQAFHRKVREGYLTQAKQFPQSYRLINAARGPEEIWKDVVGTLQVFARCRS